MLKIALCHTKPGYNGDVVLKAFREGLLAHGDTFIDIKYFNETKKLSECDAAFVISYPDLATSGILICDEFKDRYKRDKQRGGDSVINSFRTDIYKKCILLDKRMLCLDSGVMNFERNQKADENTYQLGWDTIKGLGNYYNLNSPPDRFNSLNINIEPWKYKEGHILIFGQVQYGVGSQHVNIMHWYREIINNIGNLLPKEKMMFRLHPNSLEKPFHEKKAFRLKHSGGQPIINDLTNAKLTISLSTHSIVESVINGVPSFAFSKLSMGSPIFHVNSIEEMIKKYKKQDMPKQEDVSQWFYDLAYTQWKVSEISSGSAWNHLRPHYKKEIGC